VSVVSAPSAEVPRLVVWQEECARLFVVGVVVDLLRILVVVVGWRPCAAQFAASRAHERLEQREALGAESVEQPILVQEVVCGVVREECLGSALDVVMAAAQRLLGAVAGRARLAEPIDELVDVVWDLVNHLCIGIVLVGMIAAARENLQQTRARGRLRIRAQLENDLEEDVARRQTRRARIEPRIATGMHNANLGLVERELRRKEITRVTNDGVQRKVGPEGVARKVPEMDDRHKCWQKSGT
jgi:hypothetical protein